MELDKAQAVEKVVELMPEVDAERARLDEIDKWARWHHDEPHVPSSAASAEYKALLERSPTPWGMLVVTALAQHLFVDGYRSGDATVEAAPWKWWQKNRMDARQIGIHRAALNYGQSYAMVLPGTDELTGESTPKIRGISPRRMVAFYADEVEDDWPELALRVDHRRGGGWTARLYDSQACHTIEGPKSKDQKPTWRKTALHEVGVCPFVKYSNALDLEGRSNGEIEPIIATLGRIGQTVGDRLIVQRFASWVVRTISGMEIPESDAEAMMLRIQDILVAESPDARFGTLAATPLSGFIEAKDADIRDLAAVTQTPPHYLLGQMANLSAEALIAAESALSAKTTERKQTFGESHEQTLRLAAHVDGDKTSAADHSAQVRWRDTQSRSLAQIADALSKLSTLEVPHEILWEMIPGWTKQDVDAAKKVRDSGGQLEKLLAEFLGQSAPAVPEISGT